MDLTYIYTCSGLPFVRSSDRPPRPWEPPVTLSGQPIMMTLLTSGRFCLDRLCYNQDYRLDYIWVIHCNTPTCYAIHPRAACSAPLSGPATDHPGLESQARGRQSLWVDSLSWWPYWPLADSAGTACVTTRIMRSIRTACPVWWCPGQTDQW